MSELKRGDTQGNLIVTQKSTMAWHCWKTLVVQIDTLWTEGAITDLTHDRITSNLMELKGYANDCYFAEMVEAVNSGGDLFD